MGFKLELICYNGMQWHAHLSLRLRRKHVLRVAVVIAVALEALAQAGGGITRAAVRALRNVLVGGASCVLRDRGVAVAGRGQALDHVQVVGGAREYGSAIDVEVRAFTVGGLADLDFLCGSFAHRFSDHGEVVDVEARRSAHQRAERDVVDHRVDAQLQTGAVLRCDAPCAYLAELAAGERLTERDCRTGYRLHAVAAVTDEQRLARGNIAIGGATVRGHVDVGGGGDGGTEVLRDGFLLGCASENEVVGVGPSSEGIHDKRAVRVEVELVVVGDRCDVSTHGGDCGGLGTYCGHYGDHRNSSCSIISSRGSAGVASFDMSPRDVARGRTAREGDAHVRGRRGRDVAARLVQVLVGRVVAAALDGVSNGGIG